MTQDTIADKVRKLLRLAQNNNSPEEAALAGAKAQALIDQHKLSQALLELDADASAEPDEPIVNFGTKGAPLDDGKQNDRWRWSLAYLLMKANACRGYMDQGKVHIVGRPSDVETVRYLYAYLKGEIERLVKRDARGTGKTWTNNYRLGIIDTLGRKLAEQQRASKQEAQAATGGDSLALVRVNTALARVEQKGEDVAQWLKANMKLRTGGKGKGNAGNYDPLARSQGQQAGQEIALNRAKEGLGSGQRALGRG